MIVIEVSDFYHSPTICLAIQCIVFEITFYTSAHNIQLNASFAEGTAALITGKVDFKHIAMFIDFGTECADHVTLLSSMLSKERPKGTNWHKDDVDWQWCKCHGEVIDFVCKE